MFNRALLLLSGDLVPQPRVIARLCVQAAMSAATMRPMWLRVVLGTICISLSFARADAQSLYAGAGVGPTPALDGAGGNRNWFGMVGYQGAHAVGGRLSGTETASRLWLSADLVYQPGSAARAIRPYGLLGAGIALDFNDADATLMTGVGLRAHMERLIFVFVEARLQAIPGTPESGPRAILPITFGLGLGH